MQDQAYECAPRPPALSSKKLRNILQLVKAHLASASSDAACLLLWGTTWHYVVAEQNALHFGPAAWLRSTL